MEVCTGGSLAHATPLAEPEEAAGGCKHARPWVCVRKAAVPVSRSFDGGSKGKCEAHSTRAKSTRKHLVILSRSQGRKS